MADTQGGGRERAKDSTFVRRRCGLSSVSALTLAAPFSDRINSMWHGHDMYAAQHGNVRLGTCVQHDRRPDHDRRELRCSSTKVGMRLGQGNFH